MTDSGWGAHFGLCPEEHFAHVPHDRAAPHTRVEEPPATPGRGAAIGKHAHAAVAAGFSARRQTDGILAAAAAP